MEDSSKERILRAVLSPRFIAKPISGGTVIYDTALAAPHFGKNGAKIYPETYKSKSGGAIQNIGRIELELANLNWKYIQSLIEMEKEQERLDNERREEKGNHR